MKTIKTLSAMLALSLVVSCSDDANVAGDARPPVEPDAATTPKVWVQVEHLARPGINEALLFTNAFNAGYNATAPTFGGVPQATLDAVVGEAKTVLKAIYLGACLLNGVIPGLTAATGVKPAGITCHAIGGALFVENNAVTGVTLTAASMTAAQNYADIVFRGFIPDVMRIDMSVATSTYENLCGAGVAGTPFLCGGRFLDDDTIDTTYDFLINGAATAPQGDGALFTQFSALVSDGVQFGAIGNKNNRTPANASNPAQFHPAVSGTFPYSANPL